jgi:hypothetical protein
LNLNVVTVSNFISWIMNNKLCKRQRSWSSLRHYPGIYWEWSSNVTGNLTHDSQYLNNRYPGHELTVLSILVSTRSTRVNRACVTFWYVKWNKQGPGLLSTYLTKFSGLRCTKDGERLTSTNHNKALGITL